MEVEYSPRYLSPIDLYHLSHDFNLESPFELDNRPDLDPLPHPKMRPIRISSRLISSLSHEFILN
jgi:hypothetical protein